MGVVKTIQPGGFWWLWWEYKSLVSVVPTVEGLGGRCDSLNSLITGNSSLYQECINPYIMLFFCKNTENREVWCNILVINPSV